MKRTITVKKRNGTTKSVVTEMTDEEALRTLQLWTEPAGVLAQNGFACSLADQSTRHALSEVQVNWAIVLIEEARQTSQEDAPGEEAINLQGLFPLFDRAKGAQKRLPQLRLLTKAGDPVRIQVCGDRSRYPGDLRVTDGGPYGDSLYFGRIAQDGGGFRRGKDCTDDVVELLLWSQDHLDEAASQHGLATGTCSFCGKELSTKESRSVGYGPICAGKWGLPWGAIDPALEAEGARVLTPIDHGEDHRPLATTEG